MRRTLASEANRDYSVDGGFALDFVNSTCKTWPMEVCGVFGLCLGEEVCGGEVARRTLASEANYDYSVVGDFALDFVNSACRSWTLSTVLAGLCQRRAVVLRRTVTSEANIDYSVARDFALDFVNST